MEEQKDDDRRMEISDKIYVGILQLNSMTKYGSNKSGVPYYLCKPVKHGDPIFYVASAKKDRKKMWLLR